MNKKQDLGEPCLTPIIVIIIAVPIILWVTPYMATRTLSITAPQLSRFNTENNICLSTRS